jgi:hypothetical protein
VDGDDRPVEVELGQEGAAGSTRSAPSTSASDAETSAVPR